MTITASRRTTQIAFILLVFLMPVLNIFRYDTASKELIILGQVWSLGLKEAFYADHSMRSAGVLVTSILVRHSLCKYICAAGLMQFQATRMSQLM